jgi:hypothetical protein
MGGGVVIVVPVLMEGYLLPSMKNQQHRERSHPSNTMDHKLSAAQNLLDLSKPAPKHDVDAKVAKFVSDETYPHRVMRLAIEEMVGTSVMSWPGYTTDGRYRERELFLGTLPNNGKYRFCELRWEGSIQLLCFLLGNRVHPVNVVGWLTERRMMSEERTIAVAEFLIKWFTCGTDLFVRSDGSPFFFTEMVDLGHSTTHKFNVPMGSAKSLLNTNIGTKAGKVEAWIPLNELQNNPEWRPYNEMAYKHCWCYLVKGGKVQWNAARILDDYENKRRVGDMKLSDDGTTVMLHVTLPYQAEDMTSIQAQTMTILKNYFEREFLKPFPVAVSRVKHWTESGEQEVREAAYVDDYINSKEIRDLAPRMTEFERAVMRGAWLAVMRGDEGAYELWRNCAAPIVLARGDRLPSNWNQEIYIGSLWWSYPGHVPPLDPAKRKKKPVPEVLQWKIKMGHVETYIF